MRRGGVAAIVASFLVLGGATEAAAVEITAIDPDVAGALIRGARRSGAADDATARTAINTALANFTADQVADLVKVAEDVHGEIDRVGEWIYAVNPTREQVDAWGRLWSADSGAARLIVSALRKDLWANLGSIQVEAGQIKLGSPVQASIHKLRFAELAPDDALKIVLACAKKPDVDEKVLDAFKVSKSYRLRFEYLRAKTRVWLTELVGPLDTTPTEGEWNRLFDLYAELGFNTSQYGPDLVARLTANAKTYALSRRPPNWREFVEYYQMYEAYFSDMLQKVWNPIAKSTEAYGAAATKAFAEVFPGKTAPTVTAEPWTKARSKASDRLVRKAVAAHVLTLVGNADVTAAATAVGAPAEFVGVLDLGLDGGLNERTDPLLVGKLRGKTLKFSSESAVAYHAMKHWNELPRLCRESSAPTQVAKYAACANQVVQEGLTNGTFRQKHGQEGSAAIEIRAVIDGRTLRAFVVVTLDGKAFLASSFEADDLVTWAP